MIAVGSVQAREERVRMLRVLTRPLDRQVDEAKGLAHGNDAAVHVVNRSLDRGLVFQVAARGEVLHDHVVWVRCLVLRALLARPVPVPPGAKQKSLARPPNFAVIGRQAPCKKRAERCQRVAVQFVVGATWHRGVVLQHHIIPHPLLQGQAKIAPRGQSMRGGGNRARSSRGHSLMRSTARSHRCAQVGGRSTCSRSLTLGSRLCDRRSCPPMSTSFCCTATPSCLSIDASIWGMLL